MATRTVEISDDVFEVAKRAAAIDKVDVTTLLESLVRGRAEYLDALGDLSSHMPRFNLDHYEMQRDPGETDEEYEDASLTNPIQMFRDRYVMRPA